MAASITVYVATTCAYCLLVKKFLDAKGLAYTTINMEEDPAVMQMVRSLTGDAIAPTIVIEKASGAKEIVVGFSLNKIAAAIA